MADRRAEAVRRLEEKIGYRFSDKSLLEQALTHISAENQKLRPKPTYERLEFVGDRVLGLLAAAHVFDEWPVADENELNTLHSALTDKHACARTAEAIGLAPALRMGEGETQAGLRRHRTILADVMEALLGAAFLDGGMDAARTVFRHAWREELLKAPPSKAQNNPKLALQQWAHKIQAPAPTYKVVSQVGSDHAPTFTVEVAVRGAEPLTAQGRSRQEAEKAAATAMLKREGVI